MAMNLVLLVTTLVFTGVQAARITLSLYAISLGASAAGVGNLLAVMYIFPLLLSWPVGVLSDRFGSRWLIVMGVGASTLGMLIPVFFASMAALYFASWLLGLAIVFMSVIGQNLVGVLSTAETRTRNFANYSLTGSACVFLGPTAAGISIDHLGHAETCLGIAILWSIALAATLAWGGQLPKGQPHGTRPPSNLMRTLADRRLWKILAISSLSQLVYDLFQVFMPVYAHGIGLSATVIGALMATASIGSVPVQLIMPRLIRAFGDARLLTTAFVLGAISYATVPFFSGAVPLFAAVLVFGMCFGFIQPLIMAQMFSAAEKGRGGEAVGLRLTANNTFRITGPALFGALGAAAGVGWIFWAGAALLFGCGRLSRARDAARGQAAH